MGEAYSNEIFDLQFFHHSNQPGPLTNGLKYFRLFVKISLHYSNCSVKITNSPQYHTAGTNITIGPRPFFKIQNVAKSIHFFAAIAIFHWEI